MIKVRLVATTAFIFVSALIVPAFAFADSSSTIAQALEKADMARGLLSGGLEFELRIEEKTEGSSKPSLYKYRLRAKGEDAEAQLTHPPESIGQLVLTKDGEIWLLKQSANRPVKVSVQEKQSGLGVVGDLLSMAFSKRQQIDTVRSKPSKAPPGQIVFLESTAPLASYQKATTFISPNQTVNWVEFPSSEGKLLKRVEYVYKKSPQFLAKKTPVILSEMKIYENGSKKATTIVKLMPPREFQPPIGYFEIADAMKRNQGAKAP